ncbi:MAG TPA: RHS repeat-associated core domain-containing protein, partial [Bryobacteraceae bacterium]|nr:RHS repeat-associated core domain-containing protein [Bryobacteraceae bacterium]
TWHLPLYDANGNLHALLNRSTGGVTAAYEYSPFGETLRATGSYAATNSFRFSTKYTDAETDFVYYGYRYYRPSLGRWLGRDPLEEKGGLHLYAFVRNNPVNAWDVLGRLTTSEFWAYFQGGGDSSNWTQDDWQQYNTWSGSAYTDRWEASFNGEDPHGNYVPAEAQAQTVSQAEIDFQNGNNRVHPGGPDGNTVFYNPATGTYVGADGTGSPLMPTVDPAYPAELPTFNNATLTPVSAYINGPPPAGGNSVDQTAVSLSAQTSTGAGGSLTQGSGGLVAGTAVTGTLEAGGELVGGGLLAL